MWIRREHFKATDNIHAVHQDAKVVGIQLASGISSRKTTRKN